MQYVNITVTISQAQGGLLPRCRGCCLSLCWLLHLLEPGHQQSLQGTLGTLLTQLLHHALGDRDQGGQLDELLVEKKYLMNE